MPRKKSRLKNMINSKIMVMKLALRFHHFLNLHPLMWKLIKNLAVYLKFFLKNLKKKITPIDYHFLSLNSTTPYSGSLSRPTLLKYFLVRFITHITYDSRYARLA